MNISPLVIVSSSLTVIILVMILGEVLRERQVERLRRELREEKEEILRLERKNSELLTRFRSVEADLLGWKNGFDIRLERETRKRLAEWEPGEEDLEGDFKKAEYMAEHRARIDAGRSHPPRTDAGEPAKQYRVTFRR